MTPQTWPAEFPAPVERPEDGPFWESVQKHNMKLQHCDECGHVRYPAAGHCPECLSDRVTWQPVIGTATLVSWCTFHRQYLPAFPAPHTVAVGSLPEGPLFVAFMLGNTIAQNASGRSLTIEYVTDVSGMVLPAFRLWPETELKEGEK